MYKPLEFVTDVFLAGREENTTEWTGLVVIVLIVVIEV
jgi:hypothetical protein